MEYLTSVETMDVVEEVVDDVQGDELEALRASVDAYASLAIAGLTCLAPDERQRALNG